MSKRFVRINAIRREAVDIASFELADVQEQGLPRFTAGSHIDVHVGPDLVRQYSLCNGPERTGRYVIAVQKEKKLYPDGVAGKNTWAALGVE